MGEWEDLVAGAAATRDHIVAISQKRDALAEKQWEAEDAFLCRVKTLYNEGIFRLSDLRDLAEKWAPCFFLKEWEIRWFEAGLPAVETLMDLWVASLKHTPTGPHGSWTNYDPAWDDHLPTWVSYTASDENPMPPRGQSVVYILYDGASTPCYVGSSLDFSARLKWHLKDGKPVVVWVAYPCADRDAAYALEDRLLKQHMPYLNKKRGA